jgi:acyl-CoA synthetase (NDP forming)
VDGARELSGAKPVLTVFMQSRGAPPELQAAGVRLPSYVFPEAAARALARVARYGWWRARPVAPPARFTDTRPAEAGALLSSALHRGAGWLDPAEVRQLLSCYGLSTLEQRVTSTPEDAARCASELGGPVALKGVVPGLTHKTDAGAVRLALRPEDVAQAAREMADRLGEAVARPIVRDGVALRVGVSIGVGTGAGCANGEELLSRADGAMFEIKRGRRAAAAVARQALA